jgi:hypothetical protein
MPKYRDAAKSEMDSQRELLDALMGVNRNNDRQNDQVVDFRDDRVCKFFLIGMCPHGKIISLYNKDFLIKSCLLFKDIFINTKMDEGPCEKIHSEALKESFEKNGDIYMYDNLIDREFNARLSEADRIIKVSCSCYTTSS